MDKTFAELLKEARLNAGFTHKTLHKALQIPVRTQEDWEAGRNEPSAYVKTLILFWLEENRAF